MGVQLFETSAKENINIEDVSNIYLTVFSVSTNIFFKYLPHNRWKNCSMFTVYNMSKFTWYVTHIASSHLWTVLFRQKFLMWLFKFSKINEGGMNFSGKT